MKGKSYKRRQILIGGFQYRLLGTNLLYFFVVIFFLGVIIFSPLIVQLNSNELPFSQRIFVAEEFLSLHFRLGPPILIILVLLSLHAAIVSHRIAGPLYRFKKVFKAIWEGDLTCQANLRKGDYLEEEAELINQMVLSTRKKIIEIQRGINEARKEIEELEKESSGGSHKGFSMTMEKLKVKMERVGKQLEFFRLEKQCESLEGIKKNDPLEDSLFPEKEKGSPSRP